MGQGKGAHRVLPAVGGRYFPPRQRERGGSGRAETKRGGPTDRSSDGVASGDEPPGTAVVGGCEGRRAPAPEVEADEDFMVINLNGGRNRHLPGRKRRPRLWMPRLQHTRHPQKPAHPLHRQPRSGRTQERPTPNPKANSQFRIPVPRRDWRRAHSVRCTRPDALLLTQSYPADYRTVAWKPPAGIPGRRLPKH